MIELPPELKAIAWFQSGLSRQQCVERAFEVLYKDGWRSFEQWEKARQQLKERLCGCVNIPDELLPFDKCPSCMIIDEVLK